MDELQVNEVVLRYNDSYRNERYLRIEDCVICGSTHHHGADPLVALGLRSHRAAHCVDGPIDGYYIEYASDEEPPEDYVEMAREELQEVEFPIPPRRGSGDVIFPFIDAEEVPEPREKWFRIECYDTNDEGTEPIHEYLFVVHGEDLTTFIQGGLGSVAMDEVDHIQDIRPVTKQWGKAEIEQIQDRSDIRRPTLEEADRTNDD